MLRDVGLAPFHAWRGMPEIPLDYRPILRLNARPLAHEEQLALHMEPVCCPFGWPDLDFHELRHFAATHMLLHDLPPWFVAEQLWHSDGGQLVIKLYGPPGGARAPRFLGGLSS